MTKSGSGLENLGADSKGQVFGYSKEQLRNKRRPKQGHDELLAQLTPPGTTAQLYMMSGAIMIGELAGSDRFTISLRECWITGIDENNEPTAEKLTSDRKKVQIVYKHGIESFNLNVHGDKNRTHNDQEITQVV